MNIPNFENVAVTTSGSLLSEVWTLILQQLITELQNNLSNEGYLVPQQPTTTIAMLQAQYALSPVPSVYYGNLLYDSTTDQLKVNIAGTFKVVQVV
jgi:hypothetical protein